MTDKICRHCSTVLTEINWHKSRQNSGNYICKPCRAKERIGSYKTDPHGERNAKLLSKYGITYSDYIDLLLKQNAVCAICYSDNFGKTLHVDHDHVTGRVRGLLCGKCNVGLGYFNDNPGILNNAITYLRDY